MYEEAHWQETTHRMGSLRRVCCRFAPTRNHVSGYFVSPSSRTESLGNLTKLSYGFEGSPLVQHRLEREIHSGASERLKPSGSPGPDSFDKHGGPPGGKLRDSKDEADSMVGAARTSAAAPHDPIGEEQRADTFVKNDDLEGASDAPGMKTLKDTVQGVASAFGNKVKDVGESIKGAVTSTSDSETDEPRTSPGMEHAVEQVGDTVKSVGEGTENTAGQGQERKLGDRTVISQ